MAINNYYSRVRDIITEFQPGEDSIDLTQIFARPIFGSSTPVEDYITFAPRGSDTLLIIDPDGDLAQSEPLRDRNNLSPIGFAILIGVDSSELSTEDFVF